jgi:hypothetical protein
MQNIDQHDHSGGPTGGVRINTSGLEDGSVTYAKLATNVADPLTGIQAGTGALGANQISTIGLLKSIYQIATAGGFIVKNGSGAFARTLVPTANQIDITNTDGTGGNPTFSLPSAIYTNISFDSGTTILRNYSTGTFVPTFLFAGVSAGGGTRKGKYWRVGHLVFFNIVIVLTGKVVTVGDASIGNLPFASTNDTDYYQVIGMSGKVNTYTVGATSLSAEIEPNSTSIKLNSCGAGNRAQLQEANFANNDEFELSGFYWTSA